MRREHRPRTAAVCLLGIALAAAAADAATFTVSTLADSGGGSLREAIAAANAASGADTIVFALAGTSPHVITLASALPGITGTLVIDGYSQPGSAPNTLTTTQGGLDTQLAVEIIGTGGPGFWLQGAGANLTVQGLALRQFADAIVGATGGIDGSQVQVYGNYIGTRVDGTALPANGNSGCAVRAGFSSVRIGGTQPWQRNLLSGNGGAGVYAVGPVVIEGNLIGTDASGTSAIPNGGASNWAGIVLGSRRQVRIGGADPAMRNVISGNRTWGIALWASFGSGGAIAEFEIKGNTIGADASGLLPLPNGFAAPSAATFGGGIQVQDSASGVGGTFPIGGFDPGEANRIVWNFGAGIAAANNHANEMFDQRGNVIHHNRGVGRANVDIGAAGPTPNDIGDADGGANRTQNWPEIVAASLAGNQLTLTYRVDTDVAHASWPLRIDFHANVRGGSGAWLGADTCPAASAGQLRTLTLLLPAGVRALPVVATATDAAGRSSEFSPAFDVLFEDDFD